VISSVEPSAGPAGAQVTVKGSGFKKSGRATVVTVGERGADEIEILSLTDSEIALTIPKTLDHGPRVRIVVTVGGLSSQPAFYEAQPWIRMIQPLRGVTGVPITIPFEVPAGATLGAEVDGAAATAAVDVANKSVSVIVPTVIATNGFKSVELIVNDGTPRSSNVRAYEVLPRIQSVTRTVNNGPPTKTIITVAGERLSGANVQVRYGKWLLRGTVVTNSPDVTAEANGVLPADQPTSVIVDGHESSVFPPRLIGVDPPQAAAGETITLTGGGLSGQNVVVRFGAVSLPAMPQPFASRFSVAAPAGLTAGPVKVSVIVHGASSNEVDFTVIT
jgi:IPT/TIG domain